MSTSDRDAASQDDPAAPLQPELLAPAGDWEALQAALDAGAAAVYFGLTTLNARRRARNFRQAEFARAVELAHDRGVRAYLTLNIDLSERELGQTARILELARQCRADAVLVRDPALLALRPEYPELEFHFSTQTCTANSADVAAAGELGANRVVLARELTLAEIAAASAVPGVKTEVFAQGALCFCVSGRCLLSSWAGGHSGNRGACTSPCRVPWTIDDRPAGTPLSMRDLATVDRLHALKQAGVAALKIEGRLKNAAWVGRAVSLYRRALQGRGDCPNFRVSENGTVPFDATAEAETLGAYTGRTLTCGYLDAERTDLTALAGREPTEAAPCAAASAKQWHTGPTDSDAAEGPGGVDYGLQIMVMERNILCRCDCGGQSAEWTIPKTVIRRPLKAVRIADFLATLAERPVHGCQLSRAETNAPEFLMVPRAVNNLVDRVAAAIRQARRTPDELVRVDLPPSVRAVLERSAPSPDNRLSLGQRPDRARLDAQAVAEFLRHVRPSGVVVEGLAAGKVERAVSVARGVPVVAALPPVFFEDDIPPLRKLLRECKRAGLTVEVNSWGGWRLAREAGVPMESGPGLPVLNSLAARALARCGVRCVTLSPEADRRQLEDLTAGCPAPCSLIVYGRPALVTTRVELAEDKFLGNVLEDRRGVRLTARPERGLWVFRPVDPFDLRGCANERIRVQHLVVDLVGSSDPIGDWQDVPLPKSKPFRFNYDRTLA